MIVDLAHTVATHHLAAGEPEAAASAAQIALRAGSSEDTPLLDLVAACQARGQQAQAESYVKMIMANHDADDEEDLPPAPRGVAAPPVAAAGGMTLNGWGVIEPQSRVWQSAGYWLPGPRRCPPATGPPPGGGRGRSASPGGRLWLR